MSRVLDLLELPSGPDHDGIPSVWVDWVERSIAVEPEDWVEAVRDPGLSTDQAWRLLNFPRQAASMVVREARPELVERAAFSLALQEDGPLDRRDVILVADLLPRACELAGLDFEALVVAGCARAGDRGTRCLAWLRRRAGRRPEGYEEVGEGHTFLFRSRPSDLDPDDLLRRLRGRGTT